MMTPKNCTMFQFICQLENKTVFLSYFPAKNVLYSLPFVFMRQYKYGMLYAYQVH
ncbi:hypothetical protein dsmv_1879 [Desulfococcus multivorans DSM 2059]|uniref:Uncharacterized protein n=1 Tax=Desulfococcus multivorans DSM 2059 TaxID=1121405 RepID=S7TYS5_DESML|nr:hypothetical protein dsmv_1879 [Desulfococcus multivorans DSM 2059]SJZ93717.1 hypothetical protein SAMN02745446_02157 [Desulfococcus multivorans DSM 2059]